jgi:hypothetical protein
MSNESPMSIHRGIARDDQFFNWDHSTDDPTTSGDFEFHMARWVESNNPGAQASCTLKRAPLPHVYVVDMVLAVERSSLFCSSSGRMDISFIVVNGRAMTSEYEEFIVKLEDVDLSRLDELTI